MKEMGQLACLQTERQHGRPGAPWPGSHGRAGCLSVFRPASSVGEVFTSEPWGARFVQHSGPQLSQRREGTGGPLSSLNSPVNCRPKTGLVFGELRNGITGPERARSRGEGFRTSLLLQVTSGNS